VGFELTRHKLIFLTRELNIAAEALVTLLKRALTVDGSIAD